MNRADSRGSLPGHSRYPQLFSPLRIGSITLPNRITQSAMGTVLGSLSGVVTERQARYYAARAAGGVALIVTEQSGVHAAGYTSPTNMGLYDDRFIPGLRMIADAVHAAGGFLSAQLGHQGRMVGSAVSGRVPVAPSPFPRFGAEPPRPLKEDEIGELAASFGEAAARARTAGYDAVELHMAHGYLIQQFFSPFSNHRTDRYGGSFDNRARFPLEVLASVRRAVGPDFPVTCKLALSDGVPSGGYELEEGIRLACRLEEAGMDAITVSVGGGHGEGLDIVPPMVFPRGLNVPAAEALKRDVRIPVGVVGRITTPELAEQILAEGRADYIALGRALIADNEWVMKAAEGRPEDICPCIGCLQGCYDRRGDMLPISCLTNPRAAREADFPWEPARARRRVLVIGGGLAGMQAAITAARRGHEVSLWERGERLGGTWRATSAVPANLEFGTYLGYLEKQIERCGVAVALGREATADDVLTEEPDAVIVAVGSAARPATPPGDGSVPIVELRPMLLAEAPPGEHIVVVGGGRIAWGAATWLAEHGKRVTLLAEGKRVGGDAGPLIRRVIQREMRDSTIVVLPRATLESISCRRLILERDGVRDFVSEVDALVIDAPQVSNAGLADQLAARGVSTMVVGDARDPRDAFRAVHEAFIGAYDLP